LRKYSRGAAGHDFRNFGNVVRHDAHPRSSHSLPHVGVLNNVADGDLKRWPLTPKFIVKDFRGFAMGTASANKDFEIRDWFAGLDLYPAPHNE
jgi:hypothetical protein